MKIIISMVLFFTLLSLVLATAFPQITSNLTKPHINQSLLPEEKMIKENIVNIKKQKIEPVLEGTERKVGDVVEITSGEKIVRRYPGIIQIVEKNGSTVISRGRIKVV